MNPLSKLILENVDIQIRLNVSALWNKIWKLGYSREDIWLQAKKLGIQLETLSFNDLSFGE